MINGKDFEIPLPEGTTSLFVGRNSFDIGFGNDGKTRYENFVTGVKIEVGPDDLMMFMAKMIEKFSQTRGSGCDG